MRKESKANLLKQLDELKKELQQVRAECMS